MDVSKFRAMAIQLTGTWNATVSFEGSNDNTNWVSLPLFNATSTNATAAASQGSNGIYEGPITTRYFRVRTTAYTSGLVAGVAQLHTLPYIPRTVGISGTANLNSTMSRLTLTSQSNQVASGNGSAQSVPTQREVFVALNVAAVSGTSPTLAVKIQGSDDGGTTWYDIADAAFTTATAVTKQAIQIPHAMSDMIRASWTVGGTTPFFTFTVRAVVK